MVTITGLMKNLCKHLTQLQLEEVSRFGQRVVNHVMVHINRSMTLWLIRYSIKLSWSKKWKTLLQFTQDINFIEDTTLMSGIIDKDIFTIESGLLIWRETMRNQQTTEHGQKIYQKQQNITHVMQVIFTTLWLDIITQHQLGMKFPKEDISIHIIIIWLLECLDSCTMACFNTTTEPQPLLLN